MGTREELVGAIGRRYALRTRAEKTRILDEFVAVAGLHRKHAMKLLRQDGVVERTNSGGE